MGRPFLSAALGGAAECAFPIVCSRSISALPRVWTLPNRILAQTLVSIGPGREVADARRGRTGPLTFGSVTDVESSRVQEADPGLAWSNIAMGQQHEIILRCNYFVVGTWSVVALPGTTAAGWIYHNRLARTTAALRRNICSVAELGWVQPFRVPCCRRSRRPGPTPTACGDSTTWSFSLGSITPTAVTTACRCAASPGDRVAGRKKRPGLR